LRWFGSGGFGHRRKPKLRNKSSLGEMDACRTRSRRVSTPNQSRIRSVSSVRFTRMGAAGAGMCVMCRVSMVGVVS